MTWTRLTVHWIVSDCDLGEVSVYTPSKSCVGLRVVWITYRCPRGVSHLHAPEIYSRSSSCGGLRTD